MPANDPEHEDVEDKHQKATNQKKGESASYSAIATNLTEWSAATLSLEAIILVVAFIF